jgi:hypothetical protein
MTILSKATAAQLAGAGEEPVFFDELGCLRDYLHRVVVPEGTVVYVADHRTGAWVNAQQAVFTQSSTSTAMASGLLAHTDVTSRDADPAATGGAAVGAATVLGSRQRSVTP